MNGDTGRVAARSLALDHWLFATRFLSVDAGSNGSGIEIHLLLVLPRKCQNSEAIAAG